MKRTSLPFALASFLAAAIAVLPAAAGEQPGPGLEVFDSGSGIDTTPAPVVQYPPAPVTPVPSQPVYAAPPVTQPQYFQGSGPGYVSEPYSVPPAGAPYYAGDVPPADPNAPAPAPAVAGGEAPAPLVQYPGPDPYAATLSGINAGNRNYPGLQDAVAQQSLRACADIIWQVLRERRVVEATLARGPRGSFGTINPQEQQQVSEAINYSPQAAPYPDTPDQAARRINIILDAFNQPIVDEPGFGIAMEQVLVRLYSDIYVIRAAMPETSDAMAYQELSRTYLRAATTCDFFTFPRSELTRDINTTASRTAPLFYPDGASAAGDVAGVTASSFREMLMADFYSRDDSWFRRAINSTWRTLERPARYVLDLACPDMSLPHFGPRGPQELTQVDLAKLAEIYPKPTPAITRIGLAASNSFPNNSKTVSYGGIFATRSGADANARYLAIRFGPLGDVAGIPPHYDFGSMVLMSRGVKFLIDAGGYGGAAAEPAAHSELSLNGEYVLGQTYNEPGVPVDSVWRTNASLDYATDMAGFADGKTWQRTLAYIKDLPGESRSDYWVLLDHVDTKNDNQPKQVNIRFQMAPGIQAYHDGSGILATASYLDGSALRIFAVDAGTELTVSDGALGLHPSYIYDASGGTYAAPAVNLTRTIVGDTTTATILYPGENTNNRPVRIERDSDIIRGRTGALVIDHGQDKIDVIAWAPPGTELVTPTLNLQMSADLGVFRIRKGRIVRMNFINLERFQAKEPNGGMWSMRVNGPAQTLTLEPESGGGWQVLADPANRGSAELYDINLGPAIAKRRFSIRPGEMRIMPK